jgi:hypothetical protein
MFLRWGFLTVITPYLIQVMNEDPSDKFGLFINLDWSIVRDVDSDTSLLRLKLQMKEPHQAKSTMDYANEMQIRLSAATT